jgi:hypothetical protein
MAGPKQIVRLKKGATPSLLDTDKGNELIDVINALLRLTASPTGWAKLVVGDKEVVLDLSGLDKIIQQLQIAINGPPPSNPLAGGGTGTDTSLRATVNGIITALSSPVFTIACSPTDGTITATLTFPGLPAKI